MYKLKLFIFIIILNIYKERWYLKMMPDVVFLKPYVCQTIWGGNKLKEFNIECPYQKNGEAWLVSAIENKSSIVIQTNQTLLDFYKTNPLFFNNYNKSYPLLVKIIDAQQDLSLQVHPDNEYAIKNHNCYGKHECWYVLNDTKNNEIVLGHNAKNKHELSEMIKNNEWDKLMAHKKIKKGDVINIIPGTVHAIKKNTLIFEVQQSSDITYRLYDYNRLDFNNNLRPLHIEQSIDVIYYPQHDLKIINHNNTNKNIVKLIDNDCFSFYEIKNFYKNKYCFKQACWLQITVIEGNGILNDKYRLNKGSTFLVANNASFLIDGNLKMLISFIKK